MYLPSMPTLEKSFAASTAAVQFTLSTFFFGFAIGQSIFGPMTDRFGRKPPLYFSLALFAISSLGCAWSHSISMLALWRFAQAIGACAGGVVARAMVRDLFPPHETLRIFATLMLVMGVAPMLAPLLGGYILTWLGWEAIFITLAVLGVVCLIAVVFRLPETRRGDRATSLHVVDVARGYGALLKDRIFLGNALAGVHEHFRNVRVHRHITVRLHHALQGPRRSIRLDLRAQCAGTDSRIAVERSRFPSIELQS
jgi:DHA1 family bicyclomycin/chloramphenicol resistance-like MFS transporter